MSKAAITSVFAGQPNGTIFSTYDVELQFQSPDGTDSRISGSIPGDPLPVWEMEAHRMMRDLKVDRDDIDTEEVKRRVLFFLAEEGRDIEEMKKLTPADFEKMAREHSSASTNVFRRDDVGLWFPSHALKAALKEAMNILYGRERFGPTQKGGMGFIAERVFPNPGRIRLERDGEILTDVDGVDIRHGTVPGPKGPRPIVTQHEFVEGPTLRFQLEVLDYISEKASKVKGAKTADEELRSLWPSLWSFIERNGLGSQRKVTGYGRFVTTRFERVEQAASKSKAA